MEKTTYFLCVAEDWPFFSFLIVVSKALGPQLPWLYYIQVSFYGEEDTLSGLYCGRQYHMVMYQEYIIVYSVLILVVKGPVIPIIYGEFSVLIEDVDVKYRWF